MEITVVGTGYVGLVAGVCFADVGHKVTCVDNNPDKINALNDGKIPIYEPGLEDILRSAQSRLSFTTDLSKALAQSEVAFIAVGTPETADGSADLGPTFSVLEGICKTATSPKIIVLKSTVPVGTNKKVQEYIDQHSEHAHEVVNNPEFLKEGAAIDDFLRPDRVVIGCKSEHAQKVMGKIYGPFVRNGHPIIFMSNTAAELTKYAANSFLATKITFMNEVANYCERVGADVDKVRAGMGSDSRIGKRFLFPGIGYGGSCFPKDVKALQKAGADANYDFKILDAVIDVNSKQKTILLPKIENHFNGNLKNKKIAIWGLAFKPETDDIREAPSIDMMKALLENEALLSVFDPEAMPNIKNKFGDKLHYASSMYEALENADALVICTEWSIFRTPDFNKIKSLLKEATIFDGRNLYDIQLMQKEGFSYTSIGRKEIK